MDSDDNENQELKGVGKSSSSKKRKRVSDGDKVYTSNSSDTKVPKKSDRPVRIKKPTKVFDDMPAPTKIYTCTAKGCMEPHPQCCLQASNNCARDGHTSRWYHMSLGEHFCNECFENFYRELKPGYEKYNNWCNLWYDASVITPSIKMFIAESVLPYWFQCTVPNCGKWREYRMDGVPNSEFIHNFKCQIAYKRVQKNHCSIVEESCVSDLSKKNWLCELAEIPLLKKSPAGPYLKLIYPEGMGNSPQHSNIIVVRPPKYIQPFLPTLNGQSEVWIKPDIITHEEIEYVPNDDLYHRTYMAIRDLIVALWTLVPYTWLTAKKVNEYLICRGLARIYLLSYVDKILKFLTQKGFINYGLVSPPPGYCPLSPVSKETVVIIGSGMAGLSAAKHLSNHGVKTIVLESKSRIGGRIWDVKNLAHGAHVICGLINNPLTIMCHQEKLPMDEVVSDVVMISLNGSIISEECKDKVEYLFGQIKTGFLAEAKANDENSNWYDLIIKNQSKCHNHLSSLTQEQNDVFKCMLHLNELEQRLPYKRLTALKYEHPKPVGEDGMISKGLFFMVNQLAEGLDLKLETKVKVISIKEDHVSIETNKGTLTASKVIITVPLSVLQARSISFYPPLPDNKIKCIDELGCYHNEKIFLQFPNMFWSFLLKDGKKRFAVVTKEAVPFQLFEDVTDKDDQLPTLVSYISDSSFNTIKDKSDKEQKEMCIKMLRKIFRSLKVDVPEPSYYFVTRWSIDPDIQSAGSFVKVHSSYSLYDTMAEDIDEKLYFAGEATHRNCPNSVTGAFLSGLREATKILDSISPLVPHNSANAK